MARYPDGNEYFVHTVNFKIFFYLLIDIYSNSTLLQNIWLRIKLQHFSKAG